MLVLIPAAICYLYARWLIGEGVGIVSMFEEGRVAGFAVLIPVLRVVGVPILEEFYFRELLQREISILFGNAGLTIVAGGIWFAAVHAGIRIPPALIVGLFSAAARTVAGNLAPCVTTHALANLAIEIAARAV